MAKFDADFNADIRRTIKNFNQKIRRAERRGEKGLPELRSVREFKAQFATKNDAKRELSQLKTLLNNKEALERHRTKDGTISNWEFDYIVDNLRATDKWLNREIEKARERYKDYPDHLYAIREDINRLMDEKQIINRDLAQLTARELKTVSATIDNYKRRNIKISAGREYFMRNLDTLLQAKGLPKSQRNKMYAKIDKLTNDQFLEFYKRHDIVSDIMIMIPSDPANDNNTKERKKIAKEVVSDDISSEALDEFANSLDDYIEETKTTVDHTGQVITNNKGEKISYEEFLKLFK